MAGYLDSGYAESLSQFGKPRQLIQSGGWILEKVIPGHPYHDAEGCYPLFFCKNWTQLHRDLEQLERCLVTICAVTDPFGGYDENYLHYCFKDIVIPFKKHYVVDLTLPRDEIVSKHHRYYSARAIKDLRVEYCTNPMNHIDEWLSLYSFLINRHNIKGISAFSRSAFLKQLDVPGLVMFRSVYEGETVGMHLWFVHEKVAYSHLLALSEIGYDLMASYALYWYAIKFFSSKTRWLDLGGSSGLECDENGGLSRFKKGWSTGFRTAYFCGRIFDAERYSYLVSLSDSPSEGYFPLYRS